MNVWKCYLKCVKSWSFDIILERVLYLKTNSCHDAKFVFAGGTVDCNEDDYDGNTWFKSLR